MVMAMSPLIWMPFSAALLSYVTLVQRLRAKPESSG